MMRRICKHRFTLIELLVVISMIGILMTMLLPSLRQARDKAYQAVCLSNLKQSNLAIQMYTESHAGKIITITRPANADWSSWHGWARQLVNSDFMDLKVNPEYACPKADTTNLDTTATYHSYGVNARLTTNNLDSPNNSWQQGDIGGQFYEWLTPALVADSADTMLLVETRSGQTHHISKQKSYIKNMSAAWLARVWTIHNPVKSATALFLDGHAGPESMSDFRTKFGTNLDFSHSTID
jgi:prepilin-type N-terminal cleavage/methylation domain-containing protein